jgi:flavin reductase (DIM6/NTAB) family NADH-FMN oxidoreductase RutF
MMKSEANKKSCLQPMPKILVSCRGKDGRDNALAVAYCGNCSYDPPMVMVGIVPSRYSYHIVKETGCFVVNLVPKSYADTFFELGKRSGRDEDKLTNLHVNTQNGLKVNAPILTDCPVNIECSVVYSILTGSHEMFIGRIEYVHGDQSLLMDDGGIDFSRLDLL